MTNFAPFDTADYLTDAETIAEYLSASLEDPNPGMFLVAVKNVARACVIPQEVVEAHDRANLYRFSQAFSRG